MFNNIVGIISAPNDTKIGKLTEDRPFATVGLGSRYRVIDYTLSNFSKSGIDDVVYCTETPSTSLLRHLRSGKPWDMSRKNGGLLLNFRVQSDMAYASNELQQFHQLALEGSVFEGKDYVVINTNISNIYAADFSHHMLLAQGDDVDIIASYAYVSAMEIKNQGLPTFTLEGNRIKHLSQLASPHEGMVAVDLGVYAMRVGFFKKIVSDAINQTSATTLREALQVFGRQYNYLGQEQKGYVGIIRDMKSYFDVQIEMINPRVQDDLFYSLNQMATLSKDEAPTYYHQNAHVDEALLGSGSKVYGHVASSVVARRVTIGKNSRIENCIIMNGVQIGENVRIKNAIIDKNVVIGDNVEFSGTEQVPYMIPQGSKL